MGWLAKEIGIHHPLQRRGARRAGWVKTATKYKLLNTEAPLLALTDPPPTPPKEGTSYLLYWGKLYTEMILGAIKSVSQSTRL